MQKFSTYFPAVFFNLTWKLASKMRMNTIRQPESINHKIELLGDFHFNEFLKTAFGSGPEIGHTDLTVSFLTMLA